MRTPKLLAAGSSSINMTPMIDVVFLLIIFFLVSSHLAKQENQLELALPNASSGLDEQVQRESLTVNVSTDGQWQIAGTVVDSGAASKRMRGRVMQSGQSVQLRIRTDRDVPYSRIEPLLRLATEAGVGDIVFSVVEAGSP